MTRFILTSFLWLCYVLAAPPDLAAQIDSLNISGPQEVTPGQLVRLRAEIEPEESPFWIVLKPSDLDYEQVDNGRRLIFAAGPTPNSTIVVMLLAQSVKDGRIVTRQLRRQIEIQTIDRTPNIGIPDVGPTPPKDPPISDSVTLAAAKAFQTVTNPAARSKANVVAANFELIAQRCEADEFADLPAIWLTLSKLNRTTLEENSQHWNGFGIEIQAVFKQLKLTKVSSHAQPLRSVAAAIKKGSKR